MAGPSLAALLAEVQGRHARIRHRRFATRLDTVVLPTKGAARDLIQTIKDRVPLDLMLPDEFTPLLRAILDWHPGKARKLQFGCRGFMVRHNPPYRSDNDRGFWIVTERPPPELVAFSYITCFEPIRAADDPIRRLSEAGRAAIGMSQWWFKQPFLGQPCPRCPPDHPTVLTTEDAQVDHVDPKFRDILLAFHDKHGLPPQGLEHRPTYGWRFVHDDDAVFFAEFHDAMARVREAVCPACNAAAERGR